MQPMFYDDLFDTLRSVPSSDGNLPQKGIGVCEWKDYEFELDVKIGF